MKYLLNKLWKPSALACLINFDYYKIRIENFNEYRLEDQINEQQLAWLDKACNFLRVKESANRDIEKHYVNNNLKRWKKELELKWVKYNLYIVKMSEQPITKVIKMLIILGDSQYGIYP